MLESLACPVSSKHTKVSLSFVINILTAHLNSLQLHTREWQFYLPLASAMVCCEMPEKLVDYVETCRDMRRKFSRPNRAAENVG